MNFGRADILFVERLSEPHGPRFDAMFAIYRDTISPSEQKPRAAIEAMAQSKNYRLFVATSGGILVGFSILYVPFTKGFALLEYMAVRETEQGKGAGTQLFQKSIAAFKRSDGDCPILLEVDSDREITPDHVTRLRRIQFYRKLGCRRIHGLAYLMPSVGRGTPPQLDMYVLQPGAATITKSDLRNWLTTIYQEIYKRPCGDPRIDAMLSPLPDPIPLQ